MGTGEWIVIGLCIVLVAWFMVGSYLNEQRTQMISRWAREGLRNYGTLGALRRLDPSSIGMKLMTEAKKLPFPQMEVLINLTRRENFPLWLYQQISRKHDLLIIKANLESMPRFETHVLLKTDQALLDKLNVADSRPLMLRAELGDLRLYYRGNIDENTLASVKSFAEQYAGCIHRLSLQAKSPHLTLSAYVGPLISESSAAFFQRLSDLSCE